MQHILISISYFQMTFFMLILIET